jgi:hypothetical protein
LLFLLGNASSLALSGESGNLVALRFNSVNPRVEPGFPFAAFAVLVFNSVPS